MRAANLPFSQLTGWQHLLAHPLQNGSLSTVHRAFISTVLSFRLSHLTFPQVSEMLPAASKLAPSLFRHPTKDKFYLLVNETVSRDVRRYGSSGANRVVEPRPKLEVLADFSFFIWRDDRWVTYSCLWAPSKLSASPPATLRGSHLLPLSGPRDRIFVRGVNKHESASQLAKVAWIRLLVATTILASIVPARKY